MPLDDMNVLEEGEDEDEGEVVVVKKRRHKKVRGAALPDIAPAAVPYYPGLPECRCRHPNPNPHTVFPDGSVLQSQQTVATPSMFSGKILRRSYGRYVADLFSLGVPCVDETLCPSCGSYAFPVYANNNYRPDVLCTAIAAYHGLVHLRESRISTRVGRVDSILSLLVWIGLVLHGLIASAILVSAGHNGWDMNDTAYGLGISFLVTFILALIVGCFRAWAWHVLSRARWIMVYSEQMYKRFLMLAQEEMRKTVRMSDPLSRPPVWCGLYEEVKQLIEKEAAQKCCDMMKRQNEHSFIPSSGSFLNYVSRHYGDGPLMTSGHGFRYIMARLGHVQQGVTVA